MATYAENLTTTRNNIAATLAQITASPKPTYNVNGQMFSWNEYQAFLLDALQKLDTLVAGQEVVEVIQQGYTEG